MKKYSYFISYTMIDEIGRNGNGCTNAMLDNEIKSFDDVLNIKEMIKKETRVKDAVINNYILLGVEDGCK